MSRICCNRNEEASRQLCIMWFETIFKAPALCSCHASTLVEIKNGLAASWFSGTREGHPDVGIWFSRRYSKRWELPRMVATGILRNGVQLSCYNPVLFRSKGKLLLFYKMGTHPSNWEGYIKISEDDGGTWSEALALPRGYLGPVKNKPLERPDNSILCGSSSETAEWPSRWRLHFEWTDDLGKTWNKSRPLNRGIKIKAIQPSILTLGEEQLLAIGRTKNGRIFHIRSHDFGRTWGRIGLSNLPNPNSGTDAVTLKDGRQLLVYNHSHFMRSPLNVALSKDGVHWQGALVLEDDWGEFSYPACIQSNEGMVHVTYTCRRTSIRHACFDPAELCTMPILDGIWPPKIGRQFGKH